MLTGEGPGKVVNEYISVLHLYPLGIEEGREGGEGYIRFFPQLFSANF